MRGLGSGSFWSGGKCLDVQNLPGTQASLLEPPHERRGIFHKKLLKFAIRTFVPGGSVALDLAARAKGTAKAAKFDVATGFGGGPGECRGAVWELAGPGKCRNIQTGQLRLRDAPLMRAATAAPFRSTPARLEVAGQCVPPWRRAPDGTCKIFVGDQPGPNGAGTPVATGDPFHHPPAHHHPVSPEVFNDASTRDGLRRRCPARYKLAIDNMCYFNLPRNSKFRKWRPGRKPLFTGGDLNAIKTAANLADSAEEIFKDTNPAKKAVARNYRANWRKPLKK